MGEVKTIKGINEQSWMEFKELASKSDKNMGDFFDDVLSAYKKEKARRFWDNLLNVKNPISDKEADRMRAVVKKIRSEGFRDIPWH